MTFDRDGTHLKSSVLQLASAKSLRPVCRKIRKLVEILKLCDNEIVKSSTPRKTTAERYFVAAVRDLIFCTPPVSRYFAVAFEVQVQDSPVETNLGDSGISFFYNVFRGVRTDVSMSNRRFPGGLALMKLYMIAFSCNTCCKSCT